MRLADVARPHGSGKSVVAVVGTGNDLLRISERHRRYHGSEDFFLHDFHVFLRVYKHRGLNEISTIARLVASDDGFRALRESCFEISANAIQLLFGYEWSHLGVGFESGSDFDFLGLFGNALNPLVVYRFLDIQARACAAALAVVEEDGTGRARDRRFKISIFENDVGRLAPEFE